MNLSSQAITSFQTEILTWYAAHQRDLPWREVPFDTSLQQRDPYKILVSEVMSQQTQIGRVIAKYEAWINRFPTVESLAEAETSEVLRYWSGLGYNRRAINLQKAAIILNDLRIKNYDLRKNNEYWPRSVEELKKLPGIGEYTASAIACFAFNAQIAVVDTNVRKVILLKVLKGRDEKEDKKVVQRIADQLLPKGKAYEWNQALMDYAAANLKDKKIPIPKQSRFKGSNRYYRGQTVKLLLEYKEVSIKYLAEKLEKDEVFLENILAGLEKDGLVKRAQDHISLA